MMNVPLELEDNQANTLQDMNSLNHSIVQTQIAGLLLNDKRFRVMVELSLDISQIDLSQFDLSAKEQLKPDICIYYKDKIQPNKSRDILKMPNMPLLIIEILSPQQGINDILTKFQAYFALNVKSCWLVIPANESITVYSTLDNLKLFDIGDVEVIDEVINIRLPIHQIFAW
jgi:Uma2 family endonuclease